MSNLNVKICCLAVMLAGSIFQLHSQTTVSGVVRDSVRQPIPYAFLSLKKAEAEQVIAYATTETDGSFTVEVKAAGAYVLEVRRLGYATVQKPLSIASDAPGLNLDLELREQAYALDEFVVSGAPIKVKKHNDTISINAQAFADGTEIVIEDLLKKIPGIEVSENGQISVRGQSIEMVMIEGDDLFEKGYTILTKNLRSDLIDKVQVLNNFTENEMLKDVSDSDNVALNLTLKKDKKAPLTGNVEAGVNPQLDRYASRLNLLSIRKKVKHFLFGNANNTGEDPTGDISNLLYSSNSLPGEHYRAQNLVDIQGAQAPLSDQRANFNQAAFLSLNSIYRPRKNVKVKSLLFGKLDKIDFASRSTRTYFSTPTELIFENRFESTERNRDAFGRLMTEVKFSENAKLEASYKLFLSDARFAAERMFNQEPFQESLSSKSHSSDLNLIFSQKLKNNQAFQLKARHFVDRRPQEYRLNASFYTIPALDTTRADRLTQQSENGIRYAGLEANYFLKTNTFHYTLRAGINHLNDRLSSSLLFFDRENAYPWSEAFNNQRYSISDQYLKFRTKYAADRFSVVFATLLRSAHYQLDRQESPERHTAFNIQPAVEFNYEPNEKHQLQVIYSHTTEDVTHGELPSGFILSQLNTLNRTSNFRFQLPGHSVLSKYLFGDWGTNFRGNLSFFYNHAPKYLGKNYRFTPEFIQTQRIVLENSNLYSTKITVDQYLPFCLLNLRASYSATRNQFQNQINDGDLADLANNMSELAVEVRSGFDGLFNFHAGVNRSQTSIRSGAINLITNQLIFLDINLQLSPTLSVQLKNEQFRNHQQGRVPAVYYFSDFDIRYQPKKTAFSFRLTGRNLLNVNEYKNYTVADTYRDARLFNVIGRYVLLQINIRL